MARFFEKATEPPRTSACLRDHARTVGYYEPITMILDHLAFPPKLSARGPAAKRGSLVPLSTYLTKPPEENG